MTYADRMATASFRGLSFLTDSHSARGGRRLAKHEYPGGDVPGVQDLGKKAWDWKLNAYFIGKDYDLERNGLLAKLAEPGPTWLTHPWLGMLWVRAENWSIDESNELGGMARLAIEFAEGGEAIQPTQDKVDVAIERIHKMQAASLDSFTLKPMSALSLTSFIAAVHKKLELLRKLVSLATLPLTWANQIRSLVASIKSDLAALAGMPAAYASALRGLAGMFGGRAHADQLVSAERARLVVRLARIATQAPPATSSILVSGATDRIVRSNLAQEDALRRQLMVASVAVLATAIYQSQAQRDIVLEAVVAAVDSLLPELPDAVFEATVNARAAVVAVLIEQDIKPGFVREIAQPLPAAVLAYRLEMDEQAFLARNAIVHPLFVQGRIYG